MRIVWESLIVVLFGFHIVFLRQSSYDYELVIRLFAEMRKIIFKFVCFRGIREVINYFS